MSHRLTHPTALIFWCSTLHRLLEMQLGKGFVSGRAVPLRNELRIEYIRLQVMYALQVEAEQTNAKFYLGRVHVARVIMITRHI